MFHKILMVICLYHFIGSTQSNSIRSEDQQELNKLDENRDIERNQFKKFKTDVQPMLLELFRIRESLEGAARERIEKLQAINQLAEDSLAQNKSLSDPKQAERVNKITENIKFLAEKTEIHRLLEQENKEQKEKILDLCKQYNQINKDFDDIILKKWLAQEIEQEP